jgi:hypothetical protein
MTEIILSPKLLSAACALFLLASCAGYKSGLKRPAQYRRPYGPEAPWNVPVKGLPLHEESDKYSRLVYEDAPAARPGNFNLNFGEYTYPVYYAGDAAGEYPVEIKWKTPLDGTRMPWNPDWRANRGTDGQVIILDPESGREWNLWQVTFDGKTIRATNGNLVPGNYWTKEDGFKGSRGIGIQYLAMLVTPEEIAQGEIPHALSMPIRNTSGEFFVPPATKLEHPDRPPGIPEGMRFAVRVNDEEFQAWLDSLPPELPAPLKRLARIVGTALREYGWFITDTSGGAHLQFEAPESARERWKALGITKVEIGGKEYPRDLTDGLLTRERIVAIVPSDRY